MAAQFQPEETSVESPRSSVEDDAAALRELVQQMKLTQPLTAGEELQLLERAARGDRGSEDRLVAGHLPMVIRLAGRRGDQGLSVADLVQEGSIGLVEAIRGFTTSSEPEFFPFAEQKVTAQMDAAIASEAASVRDAQLLVAAATDYERTEIVMRHELKREPTEAELAEKLEWTIDRTRYIAQVVTEARRRHDEELLSFIDPDAIDRDDVDDDDEPAEFER